MSYAFGAPLQQAVFQTIANDPAVQSLAGSHVYDALPSGTPPPLYVLLGPEKARDASDGTGQGAWHDFDVVVVTEAAGFQAAKSLAGAVSDALIQDGINLTDGTLVGLWFRTARARLVSGERRIELGFRARVAGD